MKPGERDDQCRLIRREHQRRHPAGGRQGQLGLGPRRAIEPHDSAVAPIVPGIGDGGVVLADGHRLHIAVGLCKPGEGGALRIDLGNAVKGLPVIGGQQQSRALVDPARRIDVRALAVSLLAREQLLRRTAFERQQMESRVIHAVAVVLDQQGASIGGEVARRAVAGAAQDHPVPPLSRLRTWICIAVASTALLA
ncbi:MAG: hypothetical protein HPM95_16250 [Alphaproteobacteria bacterium]|nr:hypothetical protein [Alphaproteobacteria bacterium]